MTKNINNKNYASFGLTLQKNICEMYNITDISKEATNQFEASYNKNYDKVTKKIAKEIFEIIGASPIKCLTYLGEKTIKKNPNFVLSDNSTLSIRTNLSSNMVAPREVGQAGYEKLNNYFGIFFGREIKNQNDIKQLVINKIHLMLPIFFDFLFDADYLLWINQTTKGFEYKLVEGDLGVNLSYDRKNFSFTRDLSKWKESTTLKYQNISIAEIQVHKNRTFKFRFNMKNILVFLENKENNETLGISAEVAVCNKFNLDCSKNLRKRSLSSYERKLKDVIDKAFITLPDAIRHTGNEPGKRGGRSKAPYDFILVGDKKLSLKTNKGRNLKVCPPEVGQPGAETCYLYFKEFTKYKYIDKNIFKEMTLENIDKMLPIYLKHLFDSDYLLWIYQRNDYFEYEIIKKNFAEKMKFEKEKITFTKSTVKKWNESNTVKYDGVSIGEFQVHNNRDSFKFRFNMYNLIKTIEKNS